MTVPVTALTSGSAGDYQANSAVINPTSTPVFVVVDQARNTPGVAIPWDITVSGCGLTWTLIENRLYASRRTLAVYRGDGTPSSGSVSMVGEAGTSPGQRGIAWSISQLGSVDSLGTPDSNAWSYQTSGEATLSGSPSSGDISFVAIGLEAYDSDPSWEATCTEIHDVIESGNVRRLATAYSTSHDSTPSATFAATDGAIIGFYVFEAAVTPTTEVMVNFT